MKGGRHASESIVQTASGQLCRRWSSLRKKMVGLPLSLASLSPTFSPFLFLLPPSFPPFLPLPFSSLPLSLPSYPPFALLQIVLYRLSTRGETFRKEFTRIGEARSLISENVCMMALTATATKVTGQQVCRCLGMITYIQETRRAGRDGEPAEALVYETRKITPIHA